MDLKPEEKKVTSIKKDLQAKLVQAVKDGDFKKAARLRQSIANTK